MELQELLQHNKDAQIYQDSLPINEQIELLKKHKKSVFVLHMENGTKLVRGDSEYNKEEMQEFFNTYPQFGCKSIEFYK